jgi:hypothetical protein
MAEDANEAEEKAMQRKIWRSARVLDSKGLHI